MKPQLEELACLYVLDQLDPVERAAFESRLKCEPELSSLVGEIESSLKCRINSLPRCVPPESVLKGIEAQIDGQGRAGPSRVPRWASTVRWGIAAVIALSLGTLAVQRIIRSNSPLVQPFFLLVGLDPSRSARSEVRLQEADFQDPDARFIQLASLAERLWKYPGAVTARIPSDDQAGCGYALFDPANNQGFIAVKQLPAAGAGKSYHLWILDTASGKTREAGALPLSGLNSGLYFFTVSPSSVTSHEHVDFIVTAETDPVSNPTKPTGRVVLGAKGIF